MACMLCFWPSGVHHAEEKSSGSTEIIKEVASGIVFVRRDERLDPEQLALGAGRRGAYARGGRRRGGERLSSLRSKPRRAGGTSNSRCAVGPLLTPRKIVIDVVDSTCVCLRLPQATASARTFSERLDVIPAQFKVIVTRCSKYCLPGPRWRTGASAGAGAADRERHSHRRHWSCMCRSPNMPITMPLIVKRKSMHAKASRSIAPPWWTGQAAPLSRRGRCMRGSWSN